MREHELKLLLFEAFLAGYRASLSDDQDPATAFEHYWSALIAGNSNFEQ